MDRSSDSADHARDRADSATALDLDDPAAAAIVPGSLADLAAIVPPDRAQGAAAAGANADGSRCPISPASMA